MPIAAFGTSAIVVSAFCVLAGADDELAVEVSAELVELEGMLFWLFDDDVVGVEGILDKQG